MSVLAHVWRRCRTISSDLGTKLALAGDGAKRAFQHGGRETIWPRSFAPLSRKIWQTLSSIKTGVILLILVVIVLGGGHGDPAAPDDRCRRHAAGLLPAMLRFLDGLGLTDVFHRLVVRRAADTGQPQHHRCLDPALPQCVAVFRASLQESRRDLPQGFADPGTDSDQRTKKQRLSTAERVFRHAGLQTGADRAREQFLSIRANAAAFQRWQFISCTPVCC